jgi:5-oxoprolinase (ATP-hydrolysing) subunit B
MSAPTPRLLACGDAALVVEFGAAIDPALNDRVLALDARVRALAAENGLPGVVETVPTYRSLLVHYDPTATDFDALGAALLALAQDGESAARPGRTWAIPVVYGGEYGIDLEDVATHHGLTPDEVVRRHAAGDYRVYMIGFMPGFALLGGLDPSIATSRRTSPRLSTPAGTISIGGVQALVASIAAPSGWHLLGRTPMRNYLPGRDPVVLLEPGDRIRFEPVPETEWAALDAAAAAGEPVARVVAGGPA